MRNLLVWILFVALLGCGGGGGGDSTSGSGGNTTMNLVPLNISLHDLDNNPIPYVDIYKIGSHTPYKLTLTNPNPVAITIVDGVQYEQHWLTHQAQIMNLNESDYQYGYNPQIFSVSSFFTKTNNSDDCLNMATIPTGGSCSYYALAINTNQNATQQQVYSYPLTYAIEQTDKYSNYLKVEQCSYNQLKESIECLNLGKNEYRNQFISYRVLSPRSLSVPVDLEDCHNGYSGDGNYIYKCTDSIYCGKYKINFESLSGNMSIDSIPEQTFTLSLFAYGRRDACPHDPVLVDYVGSMVWFVLQDTDNLEFSFINSKEPDNLWSKNVPNLIDSTKPLATLGLDDSMWWSPIFLDTPPTFSDRYDSATNSFVKTNVYVTSANPDGTVIGSQSYEGSKGCFTHPTESYQYTQFTPLQILPTAPNSKKNSSTTPSRYLYLTHHLPMVDSNGRSIGVEVQHRVHTENNSCAIYLDDYMGVVQLPNTKWLIGSTFPRGGMSLSPIGDVYLGKD